MIINDKIFLSRDYRSFPSMSQTADELGKIKVLYTLHMLVNEKRFFSLDSGHQRIILFSSILMALGHETYNLQVDDY